MKILLKIFRSPVFWYALLILGFIASTKTILQLQKDNERLSENQSIINKDLESVRLSNGMMAKETGVLRLKTNELQHLFPKVIDEIKTLGLKRRNIVQFAKTASQSHLSIETKLSDSFGTVLSENGTIVTDSLTYKTFHYRDNYYSVDGRSYRDKQWLSISNRDTLIQVVYRKRKNRWLWIFSPFVYHQRIQCKNPNASIDYAQIIQIQK